MNINLKMLSIQNSWWNYEKNNKKQDFSFDPVLESYDRRPLKWEPDILGKINFKKDNIYVLEGARGVGKTTVLKLLIKRLINIKKVNPNNIFYYSCHNLETNEQLNEIIKIFLNWRRPASKRRVYIFIDEITLIKKWRQGIGYLASAGKFKNASAVLSGSSLSVFKTGRTSVKIKNKIIYSLSFKEFLKLINPGLYKKINLRTYSYYQKRLDYYLDIYFLTGGFIPAINSYRENGGIRQSVYSNYLYWFIADLAKMGRDIVLARQILEQIILNSGQAIGYKTIAAKTKARTHLTAAEYLRILESLFAIKTVYQAGDKGAPNTRKAKKIYFRDPFLFWLFYSYIYGAIDYWRFSRFRLHEEKIFSGLVETTIFSHLIKNKNSVCKNEHVFYRRDRSGKKEINFLAEIKGRITPILIGYNLKQNGLEVEESAKELFKKAGFSRGIIIKRHKLSRAGAIKTLPLTYFLFFYF